MDEEIKYSSFQEYTEALLEKSKGVFSVFCDVFGEDRCDVQINKAFLREISVWWERQDSGSVLDSDVSEYIVFRESPGVFDIIVYFPEVEISNEMNEHHTIRELYVRTKIDSEGKAVGIFNMLRTRYTSQELNVGYKHSHTLRVLTRVNLGFTECCLGNGPIRSTLTELARECDLDRWNVYCLQLDQYVGVESVGGGPYIRMNRIGADIDKSSYSAYDWGSIIRQRSSSKIPVWLIYKFLLTVDIELAHRDGLLIPKMSALEFAFRLTEVYKSESDSTLALVKGILIGNKLYPQRQTSFGNSQIQELEGMNLIKFKGEEKYLRIDWENNRVVETVELVSPAVIYPIIESILIYVNTLADENQEKWGNISRFYSVS